MPQEWTPPLIAINNDLEQARYLIIPVRDGKIWRATLYHKNQHVQNGKKTFDTWKECYSETAKTLWMYLFTGKTPAGSVRSDAKE